MTEEEFRKIILQKFEALEKGQDALLKRQEILEKGQQGLTKGQNSILAELRDFKQETNDNFGYTQKQIDQAFENISDNIGYQEKVNQVVEILKNNKPNHTLFSRKTRVSA